MATLERMTAERYYAVTVEGDRTQLVDGQVVVDEPKTIHGVLQLRLGAALYDWIQTGTGRGLASMPTGVQMDEYNVYGPDVLWFREERIPADLDAYPEHVPDLCVEIRSQSTWRYDVGAKKRVYEAGGLPELWLVDHVSNTVLVYRRSRPESPNFDLALELGIGGTLDSPMLPGFALPLDKLFARPRP
jgi:Uma2 family endonuclease